MEKYCLNLKSLISLVKKDFSATILTTRYSLTTNRLLTSNMFTGIIETTGKIISLTPTQLTIEAPSIVSEIKLGSSIAVDGCCLTATTFDDQVFTADYMPETAQKTIMGSYKVGQLVNLELPMKANGRFDGHIVTGHVEGLGEVVSIFEEGNAYLVTLKIPEKLDRYIVDKGSIVINGISLTVVKISDLNLTVSVIPHTWQLTNLHCLKVADKVNVETDIIAKHIEKMMTAGIKF